MAVCSFCGHSHVGSALKAPLETAIETLIRARNVDIFYVGNHGGFDGMVLNILRSIRKKRPHIRYHVVLAYMPGKKQEYSNIDDMETLYPEGLETVPRRFAITYRNRWLVQQADFLICYVDHDYGGAAQTLRYARSRKTLEILNLAVTES